MRFPLYPLDGPNLGPDVHSPRASKITDDNSQITDGLFPILNYLENVRHVTGGLESNHFSSR